VLPENGWTCNPSTVDRSQVTEAVSAGSISMASDNGGRGGSEFPCSTLEKIGRARSVMFEPRGGTGRVARLWGSFTPDRLAVPSPTRVGG
jgi:hypothetical protein